MKLVYLLFAALVSVPISSLAGGELPVENDTTGPAEVWLWPKSAGAYERPELFVPSQRSRKLHYREGEMYWMLARDRFLREVPIGWVNISEKLRDDPSRRLYLREVFEKRVKTESVWDRRERRWVLREKTFTVSKLIPVWESPTQRPRIPRQP